MDNTPTQLLNNFIDTAHALIVSPFIAFLFVLAVAACMAARRH